MSARRREVALLGAKHPHPLEPLGNAMHGMDTHRNHGIDLGTQWCTADEIEIPHAVLGRPGVEAGCQPDLGPPR